MNPKETEFSIELQSKEYLKTVKMGKGKSECVLIEGTLGKLTQTRFDDDIVLEVIGTKGILRIDITQKELEMEVKQ